MASAAGELTAMLVYAAGGLLLVAALVAAVAAVGRALDWIERAFDS